MFVTRVIPRARSASALDISTHTVLETGNQVTGQADFTSLQVDESEYKYSDSESDTTAFMSVASGSRN
jgi:hypothetical protein